MDCATSFQHLGGAAAQLEGGVTTAGNIQHRAGDEVDGGAVVDRTIAARKRIIGQGQGAAADGGGADISILTVQSQSAVADLGNSGNLIRVGCLGNGSIKCGAGIV